MTESVTSDVDRPPSKPARDFDGLYKALLETNRHEALQVLCGARVDSRTEILDGPTELPRQRSRLCDKVFVVPRTDGMPTDVYHIEIQVKRTEDFQERMMYYWASMALRFRQPDHRIHQIAIWPLGGGYSGRFRRDRAELDYRSVNVPDDLEPGRLLASQLAPLALWSQKPPPDLVERVVDRIAATSVNKEKLVQIELCMLAEEPLATQVIDELRRRGMSNVLEKTETGREIARRNRDQGREQGLVEGMRTLLRATYGELADLDELAQRLTDSNFAGNFARIVAGTTLAELRS
ncbi:hypothetical protein KOI35_03575 [Actinoplanes bogorensis]|uniref:Rpn family recombination-promoting nuclease/putative transposase n=1 Tax=Paractinoplanes bogorensis TaxID=1610840 RepID=A0ABS5YGJ5_9ACTN|nr:hypothetical protein [Actinoplanes bogorensis]MBU2662577.1 hypothetical protein [Actinoplanes bogorensis]